MDKLSKNIGIITIWAIINSLILFNIIANLSENIFVKYLSAILCCVSLIISFILKKPLDYKKITTIFNYYLLPVIIPLSFNLPINHSLILLSLVGSIFVNIISANLVAINFDKKSILYLIAGIFIIYIFNFTLLPILQWKSLILGLISAQLLFSLYASKLKIEFSKKYIFQLCGLVLILISFNQVISLNISSNIMFILLGIFSFIISAYCFYFVDKDLKLISFLLILFIASLFLTPNNYQLLDYSLELTFISAITLLMFIKSPVLYNIKNKYGNIKVVDDKKNKRYVLFNNKIIHGFQYQDKLLSNMPTSYIGEKGPVGQFFNIVSNKHDIKNIGVIGLGCGTIATYGKEQQNIDFYEINTDIIKLAKEFFTYIAESKANIKIIEGNARNSLEYNERKYDLLICDGYFGGAIPSELVTYEAFKLYINNLNENGFLMIHLSSKDSKIKIHIRRLITEFKLTAYINKFSLASQASSKSTDQIGLINLYKNENKLFNNFKIFANWLKNSCSELLLKEHIYVENDESDWLVAARKFETLDLISKDSRWKLLEEDSISEIINDYKINYNHKT